MRICYTLIRVVPILAIKNPLKSDLFYFFTVPFTAFMSLHSEEDQNSRKKQRKNTTRLPIPSTLRSQWQHQKAEKEKLLSDSPLEIATVSASMASTGLGGGNGGQHQDCQIARKQAEDESSGVKDAFIPECDESGDFRPVQCCKVRYIY